MFEPHSGQSRQSTQPVLASLVAKAISIVLTSLTQPVLASLVAKTILVVSPSSVEVHRPVHTVKKHLHQGLTANASKIFTIINTQLQAVAYRVLHVQSIQCFNVSSEKLNNLNDMTRLNKNNE
jgi:hypothetical protein